MVFLVRERRTVNGRRRGLRRHSHSPGKGVDSRYIYRLQPEMEINVIRVLRRGA